MLKLPNRFDFHGQSVAWGMLGNGPPLVLIHGTPFSAQVWRRIAPQLADRWSVYYFDLLGYGRSEKHGGQDVSLGIQNRLLTALIQEWDVDRPDILAHDFGGATALRAYYLNDLRYRRLTLVDPVALAPWGSPFVSHVRHHEAAFSGMPGYMHDALLRAYLQTAAHRPLSEEAFTAHMAPWQGEQGQPAFYRQIAQMDQSFTDEIESLYRPMDCPVRILWGEKDNWIPVSRGDKLAKMLNVEDFHKIPKAGHLVQEDAPEAIVGAMLA